MYVFAISLTTNAADWMKLESLCKEWHAEFLSASAALVCMCLPRVDTNNPNWLELQPWNPFCLEPLRWRLSCGTEVGSNELRPDDEHDVQEASCFEKRLWYMPHALLPGGLGRCPKLRKPQMQAA